MPRQSLISINNRIESTPRILFKLQTTKINFSRPLMLLEQLCMKRCNQIKLKDKRKTQRTNIPSKEKGQIYHQKKKSHYNFNVKTKHTK